MHVKGLAETFDEAFATKEVLVCGLLNKGLLFRGWVKSIEPVLMKPKGKVERRYTLHRVSDYTVASA